MRALITFVVLLLAVPQCSPLSERVNLEMLSFVATDDWMATLARYLGT